MSKEHFAKNEQSDIRAVNLNLQFELKDDRSLSFPGHIFDCPIDFFSGAVNLSKHTQWEIWSGKSCVA